MLTISASAHCLFFYIYNCLTLFSFARILPTIPIAFPFTTALAPIINLVAPTDASFANATRLESGTTSNLTTPAEGPPVTLLQTPNTLFSRDLLKARTACPKFETFWASDCNSTDSPRSFSTQCISQAYEGKRPKTYKHLCPASTICIDKVITSSGSGPDTSAFHARTVFCPPVGNYIKIGPGLNNLLAEQPGGAVPTDFSDNADVAGIVLTDSNGTKSLFAQQLQLSAQTPKTLPFGGVSWSTIQGELHTCLACNSLVLQPIPTGNGRFDISATLRDGVWGRLYFVLIRFEGLD